MTLINATKDNYKKPWLILNDRLQHFKKGSYQPLTTFISAPFGKDHVVASGTLQ